MAKFLNNAAIMRPVFETMRCLLALITLLGPHRNDVLKADGTETRSGQKFRQANPVRTGNGIFEFS